MTENPFSSTWRRIFNPRLTQSGKHDVLNNPPKQHPQGLEVVYEGLDPIVEYVRNTFSISSFSSNVYSIVAIHGLNGHRENTWTAENNVHWLRDLLPANLPKARIICWGYDANTHAAERVSWQYLYDHARTLVSDLCRKRNVTKVSTLWASHG